MGKELNEMINGSASAVESIIFKGELGQGNKAIKTSDGSLYGDSSWWHSDPIPIDDFVKGYNFRTNGSVASVSFWSAADAYLGYFSPANNANVTKQDLVTAGIPSNTSYIILSNDWYGDCKYDVLVHSEGLEDRVAALEEAIGEGVTGIEAVDNLTSNDTEKALSANQGRVLNEKIEGSTTSAQVSFGTVNGVANTNGYIKKSDGSVGGSGGTWCHSELIPIDAFVKGYDFDVHSSVANVSFRDASNTQIGYYSATNRGDNITKEDLVSAGIPIGTTHIILSSDNRKQCKYDVVSHQDGLRDGIAAVESSVAGQDVKIVEAKIHGDAALALASAGTSPMAHFSFDDVYLSLQYLTANKDNYDSLFDDPFFGQLKEWHDQYGAVFSLYVFLYVFATSSDSTPTWSLSSATDKFADEFAANASWLRFGFHSYDGWRNYAANSNGQYIARTAEQAEEDYTAFVTQILRITGSPKCIDRCPRLGNFAGTLEKVSAMRDCDWGVIGLLGPDDNRYCYYKDTSYNSALQTSGRAFDSTNGIFFFPTKTRLEDVETVSTFMQTAAPMPSIDNPNNGVFFTHENLLYSAGVWNTTRKPKVVDCLEYLHDNGWRFGFPMDEIYNVYWLRKIMEELS